jgi:hypothetical protein
MQEDAPGIGADLQAAIELPSSEAVPGSRLLPFGGTAAMRSGSPPGLGRMSAGNRPDSAQKNRPACPKRQF